MNAARIDVGMQAASVGEAAFQKALEYANDRPQGRKFGVKSGPAVNIIEHPDVRRNLYTMKALTDASKAICFANMVAYDLARNAPDPEVAAAAKEREELLTPLSKAFSSDRALETTNIGIQIHGGMGFVEETGAAQFFRDVRICTIYEGTNGIQGIDLAGRKLGMGQGKLAYDFIEEALANAEAAIASGDEDLKIAGEHLAREAERLKETTAFMVSAMTTNPEAGLAGATPYLDQFGYVAGGHYLLKGALAAGSEDKYLGGRKHIATFYCENLLPRAGGFAPAVMAGEDSVEELDVELLSA
jgi:hypothetical protein